MKYEILKSWLVLLMVTPLFLQAQAQNNRPIEEKIESQRIAFITQRVNLTPEEAQSFWPIYNEYREKLKALRANKETNKDLIEMDEADASQHIDRVLQLEQEELDLKKAYTEKLLTVISAKKVIRFYAAERKFKERLLQVMSERRKGARK